MAHTTKSTGRLNLNLGAGYARLTSVINAAATTTILASAAAANLAADLAAASAAVGRLRDEVLAVGHLPLGPRG